ncbi:MAG: hypothetical protein ACREA5_05255 [Nitrosotalea sp.]
MTAIIRIADDSVPNSGTDELVVELDMLSIDGTVGLRSELDRSDSGSGIVSFSTGESGVDKSDSLVSGGDMSAVELSAKSGGLVKSGGDCANAIPCKLITPRLDLSEVGTDIPKVMPRIKTDIRNVF